MQEDKAFADVWPGYRLTLVQQDMFDILVAAADKMTDRVDAEAAQDQKRPSQNLLEKDPALEKINRLCLKLYIVLLNHKLGNNKYKSVIISRLAVLGFCNDRG